MVSHRYTGGLATRARSAGVGRVGSTRGLAPVLIMPMSSALALARSAAAERGNAQFRQRP